MSAEGTGSMTAEACWHVLERVAACSTLKRAARLREFLYFVGTKSLKEGPRDLHEQEIGHVVFGRERNYDTSQDNIVRVSATELRKRVEIYFAGEGKEEPLIFDIPRGSYVPQFRLRPAAMASAPPAPVQVESHPASRQRWAGLILPVAAMALAIACAFLWHENTLLRRQAHTWKDERALAAFWAPFFASGRETGIVLGDPSWQAAQDLTGRQFTLADFLDGGDLRALQACSACAKTQVLVALAGAGTNGFAEFQAAQRVMALESGAGKATILAARAYGAERMRRENVILIGSRESNPWMATFASQLNFVLGDDEDKRPVVRDLNPRAGEQAVYGAPADAQAGYSTIALLPGPGGAAQVLIVAGSNEQAVAAAADFLTSETSLEALLNLFPGRKLRPFELLLRSTGAANAPAHAEIVAWRAH